MINGDMIADRIIATVNFIAQCALVAFVHILDVLFVSTPALLFARRQKNVAVNDAVAADAAADADAAAAAADAAAAAKRRRRRDADVLRARAT